MDKQELLKKLKYFLWYRLRCLILPFVMLENETRPELFMAIHWTSIWLLKHDWLYRKIHGSNEEWEDVYEEYINNIRKVMEESSKGKDRTYR